MPTPPRPDTPAVFGFSSVVALIVGNMIGTGVFTSLGFQVVGTQTGFALLGLWVVEASSR